MIFLTPDQSHQVLEREYVALDIDNKTWIYWNSQDQNKETILSLIKDLLAQEQNAEISPINEYMRHTLKAFAFFVSQTINASGKNRVGIDIGEPVIDEEIMIGGLNYILILRDSGQIQLFTSDSDKVVARPLLRQFLKEHNIEENSKCPTTRCYGKQVLEYIEHQKKLSMAIES